MTESAEVLRAGEKNKNDALTKRTTSRSAISYHFRFIFHSLRNRSREIPLPELHSSVGST